MTTGTRAATARKRSWVVAVLLGTAAGLMSGIFGVGGGIVMVPLLVALYALDQRRAAATSLLAIIPIATASAAGYALSGNVDVHAAVILLVSGILGGQLGAWLLPRTPIPLLQLGFGIISILTAVRLLLEDTPSAADAVTGSGDAILLGVAGVVAGVLAGLLGVGGGIIMVPALVILTGADADVARGTSLLVIIGTALTATISNLRNLLVEVRIGVIAGAAGVPAGFLGAAVGQWLPHRVALALFAVLLVWSGIRPIRAFWASRRAASDGSISGRSTNGGSTTGGSATGGSTTGGSAAASSGPGQAG